MERSELQVSRREVIGKAVRRLRRQGIIPANLYGHNTASIALQVEARAFNEFMKRGGTQKLVNVRIAGESQPRPVLLRNIEHLPGVGGIAHLDFYQVAMGEKVTARVPVVAIGEAPALKDTDGILVHNLDTVEIEALPADLPDKIEADVWHLRELGDKVLVSDLRPPRGVTILTPSDEHVISIEASTPEVEEVPAEVTSEPVEESDTGEEPAAAA